MRSKSLLGLCALIALVVAVVFVAPFLPNAPFAMAEEQKSVFGQWQTKLFTEQVVKAWRTDEKLQKQMNDWLADPAQRGIQIHHVLQSNGDNYIVVITVWYTKP